MLERLGLRLRVFLFFAFLATAGIAAIVLGLWVGYHRVESAGIVSAFVMAGAVGGFAVLGLTAWVWFLFDENVARAIGRIAGGMRAEAHAGGAALNENAARYLGDLAPAAAAVTETLSETRNALAEAVQRETVRLAAEKARLETLLADVPVGVLLCSADHQLVFYNGQAVDLLGAGAAPGLDRSIFAYLREGPVRQAHDRLIAIGDGEAASDLLCATVSGARVLAARMRLLSDGGYVLTLRDVTGDLAAHAARERLLAEIFDRIRRPAANLQTAIGVMAEGNRSPEVAGAMVHEATTLVHAVNDLAARYDAERAGWWPLPMVRAADLTDSLRARAEAAGLSMTTGAADLILRCDGFEIVALVAHLAEAVAEATGQQSFALSLAEDGAGAVIDLEWEGDPIAIGRLDGWLAAPVDAAAPDVTGRAVLDTHATECWPERRPGGRAVIRLPLRDARRAARRPAPISRAVVYDFDLLSKGRSAAVMEAALGDLTYVVFDTETTGLLPSQGDEIVQLAAVRIVNGRRVEREAMDLLVNPGRSIPPRATEVHGITEAMVADAPGIAEVGRRFHDFAEGAVLIAHNAPFDMEFLRRHEAEIGARFDNPILDTVLLSAVVFGQGETHSLDALTHRLGITIPEEARHTAIGDTLATADAFLKLLPMLEAQGIRTFGDVLAEVKKHGRLLKDLNA
ncbi:exonuclease domain-containing protein [Albidovulum sediminicola]|uniref:DNA-directed DNA polymerase n=1 Tax=Albidovulum sediminicola TaxID=2984331 RepID=A0ABT2Z511_9RHOB|nr:exonuclease domain-containing protein [Defluviimonas sp. WL0075]MCV2866196.1 exonuclease domain-containing protein [Defluviimonas sp. WL0075]